LILINQKAVCLQSEQSKFVIADLTGNRNGVYYEAGYAQALGKEVIVTWKKTDESEEQPHFDIAQKNMIRWDSENDLYECLVKRIEATVGKQKWNFSTGDIKALLSFLAILAV